MSVKELLLSLHDARFNSLKRECRAYNLVIVRGRQRATGSYKRGRALQEVIQAASNGGGIQIHERSFFIARRIYTQRLPASKRCLHVKHLVALRTRLCGVSTVLERKIH